MEVSWLIEWPITICPGCDAQPACGIWLAASAIAGHQVRGCDPYPCRCAPKWGSCSYKRCDCWGRKPEEHLPKICCAYHPDNPIWITAAQTSPSPSVIPETPDTYRHSPEGVLVSPRTSEIPGRGISGGAPDPADGLVGRIWPPEDVTCPCDVPAMTTRTFARHCVECHQHFASESLFDLHLRGLQCRWPGTICDLDRRTPMLRQDQHLVWRWI